MTSNQVVPTLDSLQGAISDISFDTTNEPIGKPPLLPPVPEAEVATAAKCECCGLKEECTPEYISLVRDRFSGKVVCGLCGDAVKEEMEKNGGNREEALEEHMRECMRFNNVDRAYPVLYQAEAMREILKRCSARVKTLNPRGGRGGKGGIPRSSSCIPALARPVGDRTLVK